MIYICHLVISDKQLLERAYNNFAFVNFRNKNVTFSNTWYPKIPADSENILGVYYSAMINISIWGAKQPSRTLLIYTSVSDTLRGLNIVQMFRCQSYDAGPELKIIKRNDVKSKMLNGWIIKRSVFNFFKIISRCSS